MLCGKVPVSPTGNKGAMQDIFKLYAKYKQQICSEYAII
jgi:hypothetical protein